MTPAFKYDGGYLFLITLVTFFTLNTLIILVILVNPITLIAPFTLVIVSGSCKQGITQAKYNFV